ncbi:S41 family peptidase [Sporosarcina cyprini]|uniref:S41 family peptidase n=1 Tax=Sporosarcina cyprini TaxID=2910523 RepID=UPI001EDC9D63|nr:S41 family peptidase [Sporosarcina cyprini]
MKQLQAILFAFIAILLFSPAAEAARVDDIKFFVENYYYGKIPDNLDSMKTVDEVIDALDEYSRYLSPDEYTFYMAAVGADDVAAVHLDEPAISSSMLYGNIGYIKIQTFSAKLNQEIIDQWLALKKQGATKLILDLRYNGGGYVDSAEKFLGHFEGVKDAYYVTTREGSQMVKPIPSKVKFPKQTYILVNKYSASASEIVAASVIDQSAATVVGEKTKGKGTIQTFFEFEDGSALKLTVGEFTGPKKTKIHQKGVQPTIETKPGKELTTIHERLLHDHFASKKYKPLDALDKVAAAKTFYLHFTQPMNLRATQTSNKVELVKMGGVAVPVKTSMNKNGQLEITPVKKMQRGGTYMLVVHPGLPATSGRTTKQGVYSQITVQ